MTTKFKEYTITIIDDHSFNPGSPAHLFSYETVYLDTRYQVTSQHGIKIAKDGKIITSTIICETGGATVIHENSFLIATDDLLICCCNMVYSFKLPLLALNWKKEFDPATCFAIYPFKDDFIVHGELDVKRIDTNGIVKWDFSGKDIFVTQDGREAVKLMGNRIELTDWNGTAYILNENGQAIHKST